MISSFQMTFDTAQKIVTESYDYALENSWRASVVVVDCTGQALCIQRHHLGKTATLEVATMKARCAFGFQMPTSVWAERLLQGNSWVQSMPGVIAVAGGIPLYYQEILVGAIGVSGMTQEQDELVALKASKILEEIE